MKASELTAEQQAELRRQTGLTDAEMAATELISGETMGEALAALSKAEIDANDERLALPLWYYELQNHEQKIAIYAAASAKERRAICARSGEPEEQKRRMECAVAYWRTRPRSRATRIARLRAVVSAAELALKDPETNRRILHSHGLSEWLKLLQWIVWLGEVAAAWKSEKTTRPVASFRGLVASLQRALSKQIGRNPSPREIRHVLVARALFDDPDDTLTAKIKQALRRADRGTKPRPKIRTIRPNP